jgi:hypothetical protein
MTGVRLAQLVFASIESDQSPHGRAGFQMLCRTSSLLSDQEAEEIESRLAFIADPAGPPKRIYHLLSTARVVVAQATPIAQPDAHGRHGRYVAHALVADADELIGRGLCPLMLLERAPFVETLADALALGSALTGQVEPVEMPEAPRREPPPEPPWPPEARARFALLAVRAREPRPDYASIGLIGTPTQVEAAVRLVLRLLPQHARFSCTFDTDFRGGNLAMTPYWAVGLPEPSPNPRILSLDSRTGDVYTDAALLPVTAFEHWAYEQALSGAQWTPTETEQAGRLCAWMEGEDASPEGVPPRVVDSVFDAARPAVDDLLRTSLSEYLPPLLRERAVGHLRATPDRVSLLASLWVGLTPDDLARALFEAYRSGDFRPPGGAEIRELRGLGQELGSADLHVLVACWSHTVLPRDLLPRARALQEAPDTPEDLRTQLAATLARSRGASGWLARVRGGRAGRGD